MANQLVRYEYGAGIGVLEGVDSGRLVVGDSDLTSTSMYGIACDNSGNIFISDSGLSAIYRVSESGRISLLTGLPNAEGYVDGTSAVAQFNNPRGVAVDRSGFVYVADRANGAIRKVDLAGNVGTLCEGIASPYGVAVGPNGTVYVTDDSVHVVYQVLPNGSKSVFVGSSGNSGDVADTSGGARVIGSTARFNTPTGIAVDAAGNIFVADTGNKKIKKIYPDGWVTLYSGSGTEGDVLGVASDARFCYVTMLTVNRAGDLFVVDSITVGASSSSSSGSVAENTNVDKIKRIDKNGTVSLVSQVDDGLALGIGVTPNDIIYVARSAGTTAEESSSSSSSTYASVTSSSSTSSSSNSSSTSSTRSSQSTASSMSLSSST